MRRSQLSFLVVFAFCLTLLAGCGSNSSGPAAPAADANEIQQFLADNPELDVDLPDENDNEEQ